MGNHVGTRVVIVRQGIARQVKKDVDLDALLAEFLAGLESSTRPKMARSKDVQLSLPGSRVSCATGMDRCCLDLACCSVEQQPEPPWNLSSHLPRSHPLARLHSFHAQLLWRSLSSGMAEAMRKLPQEGCAPVRTAGMRVVAAAMISD